MGYTHYWYRKPRLDKSRWDEFIEDVNKLLEEADIPLSYFYKGEVRNGYKATSVMVNFNGVGDDSHENVYIPRNFKKEEWQKANENGHYFACCKTAYKPYDKYVTAVLILFKAHFGDDVTLASDGEPKEWEEGRKLIDNQKYLKGMINELTVQAWLGADEEGDEDDEEDKPQAEVHLNNVAPPLPKIPEPTPELLEKFKEEYED